jgi:hypothetical protein
MGEVVELIERDEAMLRDRIAGKPVRTIAKQFRCTADEVNAALDRLLPVIDTALLSRETRLMLERLTELRAIYYEQAQAGRTMAAAVVLKIDDRLSALLGLDSPLKVNPVQLQLATTKETSTDRIERAIAAIVGEREPLPPPEPTPEPEPPAAS